MRRPVRHARTALAAAGAAAALLLATLTTPAQAQPQDSAAAPSYARTTSVGVHNAYEKDTYPYFADALDSGAALLELDVWTNSFGSGWRVAHDNPFGNDNNCENAASPGELRSKPRNRSLGGCLADLRAWHEAHPGHRPVLLKVELKDGFNDKGGRGPDEFDALLARHLGDAVYGPGDLLTGRYATPDEAVRAGAWPGRDALAGKFLFELIPGTVEESNPVDDLWTDREYAGHLRDLAAAGRLAEAGAFPAVHGAEPGDPRTARYAAELRPWFVFFDGDARTYAGGGIDTGWYADRGYLLVMTSAHAVEPPIDAVHPTEQQARDRVAALAAAHASFATSAWAPLPRVLALVLPRG
ncbi:phosphatidylinositol-specific phospholipase C domain-containing protein [Streptomyces sp. JJ36]|uniref:phosphatidylinositol-specific phospholipase C domain-containing protein n=1 Tax=Streptomyces sp. JJ36 TaxID=2736645 RepID=UPI001F48B558|nr:phosphatidylinositol-specific phospholipase C domain-containing protein [Streptomyces sp. JJ36]MCF6525907.1 hypothetical protein [Streptomyces sp. JJ36]